MQRLSAKQLELWRVRAPKPLTELHLLELSSDELYCYYCYLFVRKDGQEPDRAVWVDAFVRLRGIYDLYQDTLDWDELTPAPLDESVLQRMSEDRFTEYYQHLCVRKDDHYQTEGQWKWRCAYIHMGVYLLLSGRKRPAQPDHSGCKVEYI
jgi:hypothetical protein